MLTLTHNAAEAIRDLMVGEHLPEEAGLRIAARTEEAAEFELSLASEPHSGDQVIQREDARVFVEPEAAQLLEDKTLDAQVGTEGRPSFRLTQQPEPLA